MVRTPLRLSILCLALLWGAALTGCQRTPDPMARQPDPATHPAADPQANAPDSTTQAPDVQSAVEEAKKR
jgi:hypothetical protein